MVDPDVDRERSERRLSGRCGYKLGAEERLLVLKSIRHHAEIRSWLLYAVHVHVVVEADVPPEKAMEQFKAYASRSLNRRSTRRGKRWAHHGSTRHLWQPRQISAAVDYVVNQQGRPMAVYRNSEPWKAIEPAQKHAH